MRKLIFSLLLMLTFCSCSKDFLYHETEKEEKPKVESPIIEDWKDGGSESVDVYPTKKNN